jgi:hypothetical protein
VSTTTTAATPTTTTTPPPSTTTLDDVKKAVVAGFDAGEKAYLAALADPASFNPATIVATYAAGRTRDNVISSLTDFQRQGFRVKPGPQGLDYYVVEDVNLLNGPPVTQASLSVCNVSDGIVYDPQNHDAIVNGELGTHRLVWTMVVEHGSWKRLSSQETEHKVGVNACPPKPGS